jgi:succinoglycan biosynthesis protein ExoM
MATVTIVMPTYNRPDYIGAAIESALAQTYGDFVLAIGDNGGSPLTEGVVRQFDDPRIRYVRHPQNLGAQGNWLELIRQADSPIVASLHDDDVWEPTFLEQVVPPLLDDPSVSMVFTDFWLVDQDGRPRVDATEALSARTHRDLLPPGRLDVSLDEALRIVAVWNAPQPAYAAALRRQAVLATEFPPDTDPIYDMWISYAICRRGERMFYVPDRLTNYRTWPGSMTTGGFARPEDAVFRHMTEENVGVGPVIGEIHRYWAELRWGRAGRLMAAAEGRADSQVELRAAEPHLSGVKRAVALTAGRSRIIWHGTRLARVLRKRVQGATPPPPPAPASAPVWAGHDTATARPTTVAVCVCTYNRNPQLRRLLEAVAASATKAADQARVAMVVVDDNPDAGAKPVVDEFTDRFPLGIHYRHSGQQNISIARNLGLKAGIALAEWVAMTDDDCEPSPGWISELLATQARTGADAITGPLHLSFPSGSPSWLHDEPFLLGETAEHPEGARVELAQTHNSIVASAWLRAHPEHRFTPDLGRLGGEDMVFFRAGVEAGMRIHFSAGAVVTAHEGAGRASLRHQLWAQYWLGNTEYVTNIRVAEATPPRLLLRAGRRLASATVRPFARLLRGQRPQWRWCLASILRAFGMALGAFGVRVRHH